MIRDRTILKAEAEAFLMALQYYINNYLLPLILQTDSLTFIRILDGIWEVPWVISPRILKIKMLIENQLIKVKHTLREGNSLADYFANLAFCFAGIMSKQFNSSLDDMEKSRSPNIRFRKCQNRNYKLTDNTITNTISQGTG